MEKGKLVGSGATADVFEWTEGTVIKIFNDYEPDASIEQEINNTKALQNCTFKFPKFIEKLHYEGKNAIVYEKVAGISMLKQLETKPFAYKKFAKRLAQLHFTINKNQVSGIRKQKLYFKERILLTKDLSDDKKEKLYKLIDNMADGNSLCHSDFHPGNVICNENGDYIIDWADCCSGNASADVARTILALKTVELPENVSIFIKIIIKFITKRFLTIYINEYLRISRKNIEEIDEWKVAVAAYRLCAANRTEKSANLKIINSYLDKGKI